MCTESVEGTSGQFVDTGAVDGYYIFGQASCYFCPASPTLVPLWVMLHDCWCDDLGWNVWVLSDVWWTSTTTCASNIAVVVVVHCVHWVYHAKYKSTGKTLVTLVMFYLSALFACSTSIACKKAFASWIASGKAVGKTLK